MNRAHAESFSPDIHGKPRTSGIGACQAFVRHALDQGCRGRVKRDAGSKYRWANSPRLDFEPGAHCYL